MITLATIGNFAHLNAGAKVLKSRFQNVLIAIKHCLVGILRDVSHVLQFTAAKMACFMMAPSTLARRTLIGLAIKLVIHPFIVGLGQNLDDLKGANTVGQLTQTRNTIGQIFLGYIKEIWATGVGFVSLVTIFLMGLIMPLWDAVISASLAKPNKLFTTPYYYVITIWRGVLGLC
jgi:hypothetical protein